MNLALRAERVIKVGIVLIVVLVLIFSPLMALAQPSFVGDVAPECGDAGGSGMCGYCDLMTLAQRVIEFLVFFGIVVAILMIIYAGVLYLGSAGNSSQVSKAHSVLRSAIFGLVIVLASYLIINLILVSFDVAGGIGRDPWVLPGC